MKKHFAFIALAWFALASLQTPALAGDPWFNRWDRNHDGRWNYAEFCRAHDAWWRSHPGERRWKEAELRAEFNRRCGAHPGWIGVEEVRDFHHW